ncbi:DUF6443 domain-containing protein [Chitinophaga sedimenti]|uniref:DUF6443 domain-containing protein n=1 Tax=Chitinophaga sedimenti TaxID=2033606 RepID=UPI00200629C5|nr:DUF6443 domain-containing protein [Chitinophaga sedimenti]MCK7560206.1 DUF6443 domain-containing protein [Chitinophaga sedimenti]
MKHRYILFAFPLLAAHTLLAQTPQVATVPLPTRPSAELPSTPGNYQSGTKLNFVKTYEPSKPYTTAASVLAATNVADVKQATQYLDGLGRPLQVVNKGITPNNKDLVSPVRYDRYGRQPYNYLPYVSPSASGAFKTRAFAEQDSMLRTAHPGETIFFEETQFEASPLNRVLKTMAPGNSWAGSGRGVGIEYLANTATDVVRIWTITFAPDAFPTSAGTYPAGELFKNVTADEHGNKVVEFKDKAGLVILKKVQLSATAGSNHDGWLCTYYVYDALNNLRYVIQPKAVQEMARTQNWSIDAAISRELCFRYEYDARNRMVLKQVPGSDPVLMVYDKRDRLVFSQDGNQRTAGKWLLTLYDDLNRPVMTALYATSELAATLQQSLNSSAGTQTITTETKVPASLAVNVHDNRLVYQAGKEIIFNAGFDSENTVFESIIDENGIVTTETLTASLSPALNTAQLEPLTYSYYDNYNYPGAKAYRDTTMTASANNSDNQPKATLVKGMVTGSKVRLLGEESGWLTTTIHYDIKGRVKQSLSDNAVSGQDLSNNLYDFTGKLLVTHLSHGNPRSRLTPRTNIATFMEYDHGGRLVKLSKKLNDAEVVDVATHEYDALGLLKEKTFKRTDGSALESLEYAYNVRGWLNGINKEYIQNGGSHFFGQELSYDYGFDSQAYNGNIAGMKWRGAGSEQRAYGFAYDRANRLLSAQFTQRVGSSIVWDLSAGVDYNVKMGNGITPDSAYDANGNILRMQQWGYAGASSRKIDDLRYSYLSGGNRLAGVKDSINSTGPTLGDFKEMVPGGTDDYTYDVNGNMITDANKGLSNVIYNHLNLPQRIAVHGKGVIRYQYDAAGNKHAKFVTDSTGGTINTARTDYVGGMVYQNDTLQLVNHEEGRIRFDYATGTPAFSYDYFVKDHLGNVRMVLTEGSSSNVYLASMEVSAAPVENALFANVDATRTDAPSGYTEPNSQYVAKLNGSDPAKRIGPSLVLRVTAGDTISLGARAFYKSQGPKQPKNRLQDMIWHLR